MENNNESEEFVVYPEIQNVFEEGIRDGSYLSGFISSFDEFNFSEQTLLEIILRKMDLSYNKEYLRMQLGSNERNTKNLIDAGVDLPYGSGEDFE